MHLCVIFFLYLYAKKRYDSFGDAKTSKSLESSKDYAKYLCAIYLVSFQINELRILN